MHRITKPLKKKIYLFVASYFKFWANISLKRWNPRIIAVTGSVGKTTMLHLLELQFKNQAHYSHNANSAFGIAFDILGLKGVTDSKLHWIKLFTNAPIQAFKFTHKQPFYIVEIDGERPKETEFLASWLKPEVTAWVSLGRSHAMYYDNQVKNGLFKTVEEAIAHEFGFLPRFTKNLVLADGNNELIKKNLQNIDAKIFLTSKNQLEDYQVFPNKTIFKINNKNYTFFNPVPEEVQTQLIILDRIAEYFKIEPVINMDEYVMPPGRSNFLKGINGVNLIDSSYNAHLISMKSMLNMMKKMNANTKWLVIGDMTEQGKGEEDQHQKLGEEIAKVDADRIILVGRRTNKFTLKTLEKMDQKDKTVSFIKTQDALKYLQDNLSGDETILFKGSQYLEWIVEKLLANQDDIEKLPRQEPSAKRRRASWGLN